MALNFFTVKQIDPSEFPKCSPALDRNLYQTKLIVHAHPLGATPPNHVRWTDANGTNVTVPASACQDAGQVGTTEWTLMTAAFLASGIPDGPCFVSAFLPGGVESAPLEGKFC